MRLGRAHALERERVLRLREQVRVVRRERDIHRVAGLCDGVHCAMAMLLLPEVFRGVWGDRPATGDGRAPADTSFWAEAIAGARAAHASCPK